MTFGQSIVTLLLIDEETGEPLSTNDQAARVVVQLEGEFVLTAGIQPNINRCVVRFDEFARLGEGAAFATLCTVEFWHTSKPVSGFVPDVSIANVRIIDVEPLEIGRPKGQGQQVIEWRLFLADVRERMMPPRGGRLTQGEVNKRGVAAANLVLNSSLIATALNATGIALDGTIPLEVDELPPMADLQWNGAHAPGELAKLLDYVGATFIITSQGACRIELKGEGTAAAGPYGRELPTARLPGLGRRGKTIVISSAPSPVIETRTLLGPSPDTFEFVVPEDTYRDVEEQVENENGTTSTRRKRERTRVWVPIDDASYFTGNAFIHTIEEFRNIPYPQRSLALSYAWRCIRISTSVADPKVSPVWRLAQKDDGSLEMPIVLGQIAVRDPNGFLFNAKEFVDCRPILMYDGDTRQPIIQTAEILGKVSGPNGTPDGTALSLFPNLITLIDGELSVQISVEQTTDGGGKRYFTVGYRQGTGGIERLDEAATLTALEKGGTDVVVLLRKELRLRVRDGEEINRSELEKQATAIAEQYLKGSGDDYEIRTAVGFAPGELSGRTSEIRYSQQECKTTFRINAWHYPRQSAADRAFLLEVMKEAFSGQAQTQGDRTYTGGSGAGQPSVPLAPGGDAPFKIAGNAFLVFIHRNTGGQDGTPDAVATYTYRCTDLAGKELAASATPEKPREKRRVAGFGTYGIGAWDEEGNFVLVDALEVFSTGACIPE